MCVNIYFSNGWLLCTGSWPDDLIVRKYGRYTESSPNISSGKCRLAVLLGLENLIVKWWKVVVFENRHRCFFSTGQKTCLMWNSWDTFLCFKIWKFCSMKLCQCHSENFRIDTKLCRLNRWTNGSLSFVCPCWGIADITLGLFVQSTATSYPNRFS